MTAQASEVRQPHHGLEQQTDLPVGEVLRRTRMHYGLSLADVEVALRIRASQLHALESGDTSQLPGRVYAIGFVRTYSEYLGLDGDKMVYLFKAQLVGNKPRPELSFPVPASESKLPNLYILGSSFAGLVAIIAAFFIFGSKPQTMDIPPVPETLKAAAIELETRDPFEAAMLNAIEPAGGIEELASSIETIEEAPPADRIVINVKDNVWLEIRDGDKKALISRILKPGDTYTVPEGEGMVMDTGNVGALEIVVDGVSLPQIGEVGDVKRNIKLDPEELVSLYGEPVEPVLSADDAETADIVTEY